MASPEQAARVRSAAVNRSEQRRMTRGNITEVFRRVVRQAAGTSRILAVGSTKYRDRSSRISTIFPSLTVVFGCVTNDSRETSNATRDAMPCTNGTDRHLTRACRQKLKPGVAHRYVGHKRESQLVH
jgi:hypothetical protein